MVKNPKPIKAKPLSALEAAHQARVAKQLAYARLPADEKLRQRAAQIVGRAIASVRKVGGLSRGIMHEEDIVHYNREQVAKMFAAIERELETARARFTFGDAVRRRRVVDFEL